MSADTSKIISRSDIEAIHGWIAKMEKYQSLTVEERVHKCKNTIKLNYRIIGNGKHRIVYDLNDGNVLKVALSNWGNKNNETEYYMFKKCPDPLQKYLCPVKEFGKGWIIMKKVDVEIPIKFQYKEKIKQLESEFAKYGIIPKDLWRENIAFSKDNEVVIIDYGNFENIE